MPYPPPPPPAAPVPPRNRNTTVLLGAAAVLAIAFALFHRSGNQNPGGAPGAPTPSVEPEKPAVVKQKIPDWVPMYPGGVLASDVTVNRTPQELYFEFDVSVNVPCNAALFWYRDKLASLGFHYGGEASNIPTPICSYADGTSDAANGNSGRLQTFTADHHRTVNLAWAPRNIVEGDHERVLNLVHVEAVERNHGEAPETYAGRTQPQIPAWAPIYPGTTPSQMGVTKTSDGTNIRFQLSTSDTCETVINWYQQSLQSAGFRTFDRQDDHSRRDGCDSRISAEGSQGRSLKVRAVTYSFSVNIDVETLQK